MHAGQGVLGQDQRLGRSRGNAQGEFLTVAADQRWRRGAFCVELLLQPGAGGVQPGPDDRRVLRPGRDRDDQVPIAVAGPDLPVRQVRIGRGQLDRTHPAYAPHDPVQLRR